MPRIRQGDIHAYEFGQTTGADHQQQRVSDPQEQRPKFLLCGYCLVRTLAHGALAIDMHLEMSAGVPITLIKSAAHRRRRDHSHGETLKSSPRASRAFRPRCPGVKLEHRHNPRGRGRSSAPANLPV